MLALCVTHCCTCCLLQECEPWRCDGWTNEADCFVCPINNAERGKVRKQLFTRAGVSALGYLSLACLLACLPQPTPLPKADLIGMDTPQGIAQATLAYCGMLANNYMRLMKQVVRLQE